MTLCEKKFSPLITFTHNLPKSLLILSPAGSITVVTSYPGSPDKVEASRSPAARLTGLVAALLDPQMPEPLFEIVEVAPPTKQNKSIQNKTNQNNSKFHIQQLSTIPCQFIN